MTGTREPRILLKLRALADLLEDLKMMNQVETEKMELIHDSITEAPPLSDFLSGRAMDSKLARLKIVKDYLFDMERCFRETKPELERAITVTPNPITEFFQELAMSAMFKYGDEFYFNLDSVEDLMHQLLDFLEDFL